MHAPASSTVARGVHRFGIDGTPLKDAPVDGPDLLLGLHCIAQAEITSVPMGEFLSKLDPIVPP